VSLQNTASAQDVNVRRPELRSAATSLCGFCPRSCCVSHRDPMQSDTSSCPRSLAIEDVGVCLGE
ncbi:hypothetical protein GN956_G26685, partial [Arapaima gigas]